MSDEKQKAGAEGQTGSVAPAPERRSFAKTSGADADAYRTDTFSRNDAEGATALGEEEDLDEAGRPLDTGASEPTAGRDPPKP